MEKGLLILLIMGLGISCSNSNSSKKSTEEIINNDLVDYNLKGKVKSFSAIKYVAKDSFGIVLKDGIYKDGIYKDEYSSLSDYEETVTFNEKGYATSKTKYNGGIIKWKENIIRDSLNRKTESNKLNSKNKLTEKRVFNYNKNGKIEEISIYNNLGDIEAKWIYLYEENKMTRNNYNPDGSNYSSYISTYNDKGEIIEFKYLDYENSKFNYTHNYNYNEKENTKTEINRSFYSVELEDTKWFSKFNKNGDLIEKTLDDYYLTEYQYEYDEHNNWTKQIEFLDGFPKFIIEREIKYYN